MSLVPVHCVGVAPSESDPANRTAGAKSKDRLFMETIMDADQFPGDGAGHGETTETAKLQITMASFKGRTGVQVLPSISSLLRCDLGVKGAAAIQQTWECALPLQVLVRIA